MTTNSNPSKKKNIPTYKILLIIRFKQKASKAQITSMDTKHWTKRGS